MSGVQFLHENERVLSEEAAFRFSPSIMPRQVSGLSFHNAEWMLYIETLTIVPSRLNAQFITNFRIMDISITVAQSTEILIYLSLLFILNNTSQALTLGRIPS